MITAILLAAGNARRFGGTQKLLARIRYDGGIVPLVYASALGLAKAGLRRIVVVLGREAESVRRALGDLEVEFVFNGAYESGMSSSLRAGVTEATRCWPDSDGIMIALGDQPLGATPIAEQLIAAFEEGANGGNAIVVPRFRGTPGNPVIFGYRLAPELLAITGDRGARSVVERDASRVTHVDFDMEAPPDVDTIDDLRTL